jgi:DNA polymerase III alpha subunit
MNKQSTLDAFFFKSESMVRDNKTRRHKAPLQKIKEECGEKASEILPPLFIREIPKESERRYQQQLEEEYILIDANKFAPVFLQVRRILELVKFLGDKTGKPIPFVIRGSAGSSLICFLLGITHIDPILHRIQLARFMNSERDDIPDIDIDVPYNRRDEIYGCIASTWPNQVARISNYCFWSEKTALRQSVKDYFIQKGEKAPAQINRKGFRLEKIVPDEVDRKEIHRIADERIGSMKNYSKHCGGIVIFEKEGEVPKELILQEIKADGVALSQINLNKDDTEDRGYIKIDLLSNRGLAQLADICADRSFTAYPQRDSATERILARGLNIGITLGESRGMRKLFMDMKPEGVNDIAIALALIRPAAAAEGRKQDFLQKYKLLGREALEGKDRLLRPIIYDDDAILKIQMALTISSAKADSIRKTFAKGNPKARLEFRQQMMAKGHKPELINQVVDDLNQLIHYSFCKSHAVSYAQLVWALAYWKAHRVHEFWCASLNHCKSEYRSWVHYREARCSGILLSREPPPYRLGKKNDMPALLPIKSLGQVLLRQPTPLEEFKELGYWCSEIFMPTCGFWLDSQLRLDGVRTVRFRGIIACGRTIARECGNATLICIGTDNNEYVDLVIPDQTRGDLFGYVAIEGKGRITKEAPMLTVEVDKIKGIHFCGLAQV